MTYLFIGGNADGQELEVDPGHAAWRVADKPVPSLSIGTPEPRESCLYTKRTYRRGSWVVVNFFAVADMSDAVALKRFVECSR